ncbi:MAG: carboxypeptidase-like regulatory domain-containing protein, partial [Tangfeifania sp.]
MKRLTIFIFLFIPATMLFAQEQVVVTGQVTDDTQQGLPGVTILEKGTQNGTVTDFEGNYSLEVSEEATLVFSFIGFVTQEIPVDGQTSIDVQ